MVDVETRRLSFNDRADDYDLARPPYPPRVYQTLTTRCGLGPGTRLLEIGPGTGLATGELLARGADVVAVEPGDALAARLRATHSGPRLRVVVAALEDADLPAGGFDLATSATAFHWVRPEVGLPKLARVLRPGGWLAVWWTVFADPMARTPFRDALAELYARFLPDERHGADLLPGPLNTPSWTAELERGGWFQVVHAAQLRWRHRLTAEGARLLFGSFPNVNELAPAERTALLDQLAEVIDRRFGGSVVDPYVTALYIARAR